MKKPATNTSKKSRTESTNLPDPKDRTALSNPAQLEAATADSQSHQTMAAPAGLISTLPNQRLSYDPSTSIDTVRIPLTTAQTLQEHQQLLQQRQRFQVAMLQQQQLAHIQQTLASPGASLSLAGGFPRADLSGSLNSLPANSLSSSDQANNLAVNLALAAATNPFLAALLAASGEPNASTPLYGYESWRPRVAAALAAAGSLNHPSSANPHHDRAAGLSRAASLPAARTLSPEEFQASLAAIGLRQADLSNPLIQSPYMTSQPLLAFGASPLAEVAQQAAAMSLPSQMPSSGPQKSSMSPWTPYGAFYGTSVGADQIPVQTASNNIPEVSPSANSSTHTSQDLLGQCSTTDTSRADVMQYLDPELLLAESTPSSDNSSTENDGTVPEISGGGMTDDEKLSSKPSDKQSSVDSSTSSLPTPVPAESSIATMSFCDEEDMKEEEDSGSSMSDNASADETDYQEEKHFSEESSENPKSRPKRKPRKRSASRRCAAAGCPRIARSRGLCKAHGSVQCIVKGCTKQSQGSQLCIKHGGGRRCQHPGCDRAAQSKNLCKGHGGGQRCQHPGCDKSSQGGGKCRTHGGGQRCNTLGCKKGAQRDGFCAAHGGIRICRVKGCDKNDRGGGLCAMHGGGKRCVLPGCHRPSRRQGKCTFHYKEIDGGYLSQDEDDEDC